MEIEETVQNGMNVIDFTQREFGKYLEKDFEGYNSPISFDDIDRIALKGAFIRISIQNGEVFVSEDSVVNTKSKKAVVHLESIISNGKKLGLTFPNVSFVYSMDTTGLKDEKQEGDIQQVPIFTLCNPRHSQLGVRIPNMYFGDVFQHEKRMTLKRKIGDLIKFESRKKKIYFRGGASGAGSLPRIHLVSAFEENPIFDVNIVAKPKSETLFTQDLNKIKSPLGKHQPNLSNSFYQYTIHMPGSAKNEAYSYGLQELLPWGTAVIFIDQTCYEWYYQKLIDDELVLVTDLDHLEEDVKSWYENPQMAKTKAQLSKKFTEHYLNKDIITAYWFLALSKYDRMYKGNQQFYNSKIEKQKELDLDYYHLKGTYYLLKVGLKPLALGLNQLVVVINTISRKLKGR